MQTFPEGGVFCVGEHHVTPVFPVLLGFCRVRVQPHDFWLLRQEPVIGCCAGTAHSHHQNPRVSQRNGLFVRVPFAALEADDMAADCFEQTVGKPVHRRGDNERQGHGYGQRNQPFRQGNTGYNKPELAVVGQ